LSFDEARRSARPRVMSFDAACQKFKAAIDPAHIDLSPATTI